MTDLKPCPFCGGETSIRYYKDKYSYYVECNHCMACSGYSSFEDGAVKKWNTRQPAIDWKPIEKLPSFFNDEGQRNYDDECKILVTTGNEHGFFLCKILANDNLLIMSHVQKVVFPRSKYTHYALLTPPKS